MRRFVLLLATFGVLGLTTGRAHAQEQRGFPSWSPEHATGSGTPTGYVVDSAAHSP
ncbi:MAG TPA: hypothetical protein VFH24_05090 [Gemmatimonadales bacterium]|nr:hypothetical protein [Gemmatimonadales bacterium]